MFRAFLAELHAQLDAIERERREVAREEGGVRRA